MLPQLGPRVTISANTGSIRGHSASSSARPNDVRARRGRPPIAPGCCAATLAQPTRKSLDGIKKSLDNNSALRPEQLLQDPTSLPVASSTPEVSSIPRSVSAASLSSEGDLALLLGAGGDLQAGSTPLVFGSFPPVAVTLPSADNSSETAPEDAPSSSAAAAPSTDSSRAASRLKPDSHEFYPQAYLAAAAAATALAARTISHAALSSSSSPASGSPAQALEPESEQGAHSQAAEPGVAPEPEPAYVPAAAAAAADQQPQQADQQQYWAIQQTAEPAQWQHQQLTEQQWQQQQQHWQHWQQQQQQHPMMSMPVLVPVFVQPYPYPHYVQQQPQMHYMMLPEPAAAAVAPAAHQQAPQQMQAQQHMQVASCPPSPGGYSLPADTCSLMSAAATPSATPTAWQHNAHYGSSRPASSAGSVVSGYSTASRRHRQQQFGEAASRESGTVTVSAMSCVKDAAGALAKVVTRHGNCLLLSLVKPGDAAAQATHVAAKSLAVARFYVNAHMAAAGAAGIDAAAALTGVDSHPADGAAAGGSSTSAGSAATAAVAADDEVVFMPYQRSSSSSGSSGRQGLDGSEVPLGFMVAKASARDLPVLLPPPVGIPACMQDKLQQQQGLQERAAAAASGSSGASSTTLLKAGANTDVNKLSNAVIHNILGSGHVAMQLAGAAACHVAMRSLIKARDRLLRKFNTDIVATASFANEDTSSSIGRSTVFLRLDVMRSNLLQQVAAAGSAVVQAVEGQPQQQLAVATT